MYTSTFIYICIYAYVCVYTYTYINMSCQTVSELQRKDGDKLHRIQRPCAWGCRYEWVTAWIWIRQSCTHECIISHTWVRPVMHMNTSCHTHEGVMSRMWIGHVSHIFCESLCDTYEWFMSHTRIGHVTHKNKSYHTYKSQSPPLRISHITHVNESLGKTSTLNLIQRIELCVAACCSVLRRVAACWNVFRSSRPHAYNTLNSIWKHNLEDWAVCCSVLLCVAVWSITNKQINTILYQTRFSTVSETWPSGCAGWRWNLLHMFFGDRQVHDDPLQYVVCCSMWCCSVSILLLHAAAFDDFLGHASL